MHFFLFIFRYVLYLSTLCRFFAMGGCIYKSNHGCVRVCVFVCRCVSKNAAALNYHKILAATKCQQLYRSQSNRHDSDASCRVMWRLSPCRKLAAQICQQLRVPEYVSVRVCVCVCTIHWFTCWTMFGRLNKFSICKRACFEYSV